MNEADRDPGQGHSVPHGPERASPDGAIRQRTGHNGLMADDDIERLLREVEQATRAQSGQSRSAQPATTPPSSPSSKSSMDKGADAEHSSSSVRRRALGSGAVAAVIIFIVFGVAHTLTWWLPITGPNPFWGAVAGFASAAGATYVWGRRS